MRAESRILNHRLSHNPSGALEIGGRKTDNTFAFAIAYDSATDRTNGCGAASASASPGISAVART